MDLGLKGKTAIVTGGGSNIGRAIVLGLAAEGCNVVNAEVDEEQGRRVVDQANQAGGRTILVRTDVTDWDSVQEMTRQALQAFGQVDILVNNAGGTPRTKRFVDKSRDEWNREITLNLWSTLNCIRAVIDHMIQRRYGKIVNISSGSGQTGPAAQNLAVYGAAKGGIIALSRGLAWEFGRYGININTVAPGTIVPQSPDDVGDGSMWKQWSYQVYTPEVLEGMKKLWPIHRLGRPEDIADSVTFLVSERASFLTGQTISVSGGAVMW